MAHFLPFPYLERESCKLLIIKKALWKLWMYSSISPSQINKPHSTYKRYKSGRIVVIGGGITGLQRKIPPKWNCQTVWRVISDPAAASGTPLKALMRVTAMFSFPTQERYIRAGFYHLRPGMCAMIPWLKFTENMRPFDFSEIRTVC